MASYYYLMSSLPMLRHDGAMPLTYAEFLKMCAPGVKPSVYERLENLSVNTGEGPFFSEWAKFYAALAEELAFQRRARLGRPENAAGNRDSDVVKIVTEVLNERNPLTAENLLLSLEFDRLDALVSGHYFDESALMGYALKLKLLERRTIFEHDKGKAEFDRILGSMHKQIDAIGLE